MKKYLLQITCLVILLQSAPLSGQENAKRHISDSSGNKIVPNVGPALHQYSSNLESHKLEAKVIGKVVTGEDVSLKVALQEKSGTIKTCSWTSPSGDTYLVDKESVTDADGKSVDEISGNSSDAKTCHITLANIKKEQFGTWSCKISHSSSKQTQEAHLTVTPNGKSTYVRLPKHLSPVKYNIFLTPFIVVGNFTIPGHVDILIKVVQDGARNITLHSKEIKIHENSIRVINSDDKSLDIEGFGYDKEKNCFIIFLTDILPQGKNITLSIDFTADLNADLNGFYRSSYFDEEKNATEYIATSTFEPIGARRALPCFDEPAFKAIFQVNLGRLKDMSSISNMPAEFEGVAMKDNDEYMWDMYQDSPIMSTYLLVFIITRFTYKQSEPTENGVQFRVWSRKSVADQTDLAAKVGPQILEFFERHYNVPYPLPKMDMIAIPDFGPGAMENWGLITYRETALLFKEGQSSIAAREGIVSTISHELAHQWFGNLVTMEWWTDLWLNEGFAHYMQYLGSYHVQGNDTGITDRFVLQGVQNALERDSVQSSHPVSVPINHLSEVSEIFDQISYKKGGSIIRMMANFLGVEVFNKGIEEYLKKHKYENAQQDDLWQSLTEVAHKTGSLSKDQTLKEIMDTWTLKMGYPVITFNRSYDSDPKTITISQERFLLTDDLTITDSKPFRWWVPISIATSEDDFEKTRSSIWLSPIEDSKIVTLNKTLDSDQPLIANVQQTGFYRVNYDPENWQKISAALLKNHKSIHRTNRAQILDDSLTLAKAGLLDYPLALGNLEYLAQEQDYIPWISAISELNYIGKMLETTAGYGAYKEFLIRQLVPIYNHLGFENKQSDSSLDIRLRATVINTMCDLGYDDCEDKAVQLFRVWINSTSESNELPADIRYTILCTAVSSGKDSDWTFLWNRYLNLLDSPSEKADILGALSCTKEIWILKRLLDMAIDLKSVIRKQDSKSLISGVIGNKVGRDLTWNWLRGNWPKIYKYFLSGDLSSAGTLVASSASSFNTEFELKELQSFFDEKILEIGTGKLLTESAILKTRANIDWMNKHYEKIVEWLTRKNELIKY